MEGLENMTDVVLATLARMGVDPASVDDRTLRQLAAIQAAITRESEVVSEARKVSARGMPLVRVAELSGVSRQTLYNKPLLRRYSERAVRESGIEDDEGERLRRTVAEQEETIALFVKRDGELVEAQIRLREADQEIARLNASLAEERAKAAELRRMLANAERGSAKAARMVDIEVVRSRNGS